MLLLDRPRWLPLALCLGLVIPLVTVRWNRCVPVLRLGGRLGSLMMRLVVPRKILLDLRLVTVRWSTGDEITILYFSICWVISAGVSLSSSGRVVALVSSGGGRVSDIHDSMLLLMLV